MARSKGGDTEISVFGGVSVMVGVVLGAIQARGGGLGWIFCRPGMG